MLVIFDVDGTLTRTSDLNRRALAQAFELALGVPLPSQDWSEYPRVSASGLVEDGARRALGRPCTDEERAAVRDRFVELVATALFSLKDPLEVPGAVRAFERLRRGGHAVALAAGDWRESAEIKLERAGFELAGIPMASADDALGRGEIIALALARAGGREAHPHVVYVGDGVWDVLAARDLGLAVVGVDRSGQAGLRDAGVQDVLPSFEDYLFFESHLMRALQRAAVPRPLS
ncbi:MAG: HAD family hydrolase [Myxococcales bacterium]|nr:HAD family hydrolase [Myxococcales bacterium]